MRILQVIHGYPPRYNAGSEVYTQTLAYGLVERHEIHAFTREENPFAQDYALRRERDADDECVALHLVNTPRSRDRYRDAGVDQRFAEMEDLSPGGPCPFLGQEAWVSAEGRFNPCCAPDAQRRPLGELGDLGEVSIRDVWNGAAYRGLVASYRKRSLCIGCNMRKPAETP